MLSSISLIINSSYYLLHYLNIFVSHNMNVRRIILTSVRSWKHLEPATVQYFMQRRRLLYPLKPPGHYKIIAFRKRYLGKEVAKRFQSLIRSCTIFKISIKKTHPGMTSN